MLTTLLVIDDDMLLASMIQDYFSSEECTVLTAHTGKEGIEVCSTETIDVVLLDEQLPDLLGHTLCSQIMGYNEMTRIVFATSYPGFDHALLAIKAGAFDYLPKPFEIKELEFTINKALRNSSLERREQQISYQAQKTTEKLNMIGNSQVWKRVSEIIAIAANSQASVFITGETGTGKTLAAKAIHYTSKAHNAPFIHINCATLPESLIDAELFGYEKGAFTGAISMRRGVFEMAHGGTLFLDEIGELPSNLQAKLLNVLEEKQVRRIGSEKSIPISVRIITATNIDIESQIATGNFRQDLYYRLSVLALTTPPLREHTEDIPLLCTLFIEQFISSEYHLSTSEIQRLKSYPWPGNVRELHNIIERSLLLHDHSHLTPSLLLFKSSDTPPIQKETPTEIVPLHQCEINYIKQVLQKCDFNKTHTANALQISLSTLKRKLKESGS